MKRLLATLLMAVTAMMPLFGMAEGEWYHVQELRDMTKDGWHQTYETKWRTIVVDVDVQVPQINTFPIIRVKKATAVSEELLKGYLTPNNEANFVTINKIPVTYATPKGESVWFKQSFLLQPEEINWNQYLTEDTTLTARAALNIFRQELTRFFGQERFNELLLQDLWVRGGQYEYDRKTKTFGKRLDEFGSYEFTFAQSFYGIPIIVDGKRSFSPHIEGELIPPVTHVSANIFADNHFNITVRLIDVIDTAQPDIPLLSFENVKTEYEKLINAGLLREVFDIQLGYMLSTDPADKDVFWATPVWVLSGVMYDSSNQEAAPTNDEIKDTRPMRTVMIGAQHGDLVDWNDTHITRRQVPPVITWDQVR